MRTPFALLALGLIAAGCGAPTTQLSLVGSVERTMVELVAPSSEVLLDVRAKRGDRVRAGEVLAQLDPTLAKADVARAQASVSSARTAVRVADHDLARLQALHRKRVASQEALEQAELRSANAKAQLREAEASVDSARKHLSDLSLSSPVAGVLDQLPFEVGERVPAGAVVAVVLDDSPPWVRVWIPEKHVASVHPGTPAEIHVDGIAAAMHGHVLDVARQPEYTPHYALTERERAYLVYQARVQIDDAPVPLRPGVAADVTLQTERSGPSPSR